MNEFLGAQTGAMEQGHPMCTDEAAEARCDSEVRVAM